METNTEKYKARKRAYYLENKEHFVEYGKKYREENREKIRAYAKEYYQKNKDKICAYSRAYYAKHKEECNKKQREYYKEHKQHFKELSHERHIRNKRDGEVELDLKVKTLLDNTEALGESLSSVMHEGSRIRGVNLLKLIGVQTLLCLSVDYLNVFLKHAVQSEASDD